MIDNLVNPDAEDDEEEGEFERSDAYDDPFIPQENAEPQLAAEPLFSVLLKRAVAQIDPDDQVLLDFATHVAPALSLHLAHKTAKGGDFITAMRAEGKAEETLSRFSDDQSMRAHLVNGLFPVAHIARLLRRWNIWRFVEYFDDQTYRLFCAGYTLHDWLKLPDVEAELIAHGLSHDRVNPATHLALVEDIFTRWCRQLGLDAFLAPIGGLDACLHDLIFIASNTQIKWGTMRNLAALPRLNPRTQHQVSLATDLSTLADYLAYLGRTPIEAVHNATIGRKLQELSNSTARLTYHHVADVRGVITNLINNAALDAYHIPDIREPLLYAPTGVVYLERITPDLPVPAVAAVAEQTIERIRTLCRERLVTNLTGFRRDGKGLKYAPFYDLFFAPNQFPSVVAEGAHRRTIGKASAAAIRYAKMQAAGMVPTGGTVDLPTDNSVDMVAEGCALLEKVLRLHMPDLDAQAWLLDQLGVGDLNAQVSEIPRLGNTGGVPYQWYYAAGMAHQRMPGLSPEEWRDRFTVIAHAASRDLPDTITGGGWEQLRGYIAAHLRFEQTGSGVEALLANVSRELGQYSGARKSKAATTVCSLCSSAYSVSEQREAAVLFAPMVYTNKQPLHGSRATRNICAICEMEMMLRQLLMNRSATVGKQFEGRRLRYLFFYPTYFFTPETLLILHEIQLQLRRISFTALRKVLVRETSDGGAVANLGLEVFQQLEDLLLDPTVKQDPSTDRMFRLTFSEKEPLTFAFLGIPPLGREAKDAEAWVHPAFLALVLPLLLDIKVVASESMLPLFNEATELPETVAFDGAHPFVHYLAHTGRPNSNAGRLNLDQVGRALQRLTAAYLVHLDGNAKSGSKGYEYRWQDIAAVARNLDASPLYAFAYLKKWQRRAGRESVGPTKAVLYLHLFTYLDTAPEGDPTMSHAQELTHIYRQFYRAERINKSNAILRPIAIAADVILNADPRLFPFDKDDPSALIEAVRGKLQSFVENVSLGRADGRLPKGSTRETRDAAVLKFSDYFVRAIFMEALGGNRAALRGKQLNLLKNACEVLYLDQWRRERADERVEDTRMDDETIQSPDLV